MEPRFESRGFVHRTRVIVPLFLLVSSLVCADTCWAEPKQKNPRRHPRQTLDHQLRRALTRQDVGPVDSPEVSPALVELGQAAFL